MELHGTFPWKMLMQKFPWNSMEIGVLMFSMEFHGKCPNPPCKYFPWKSMEKFPWNSMEIDVLILHGIPWRIFHGNPWNSMEVFHTGSLFLPIAIYTTSQSVQHPGGGAGGVLKEFLGGDVLLVS